MKRTKHKILSGVLAVALLLQTAMPTVAFAAESAPKTIVGISALGQTEYKLETGADEVAVKDLLASFPKTITAEVEYIVTEEVTPAPPVQDSGEPETLPELPATVEAPADSVSDNIADPPDVATNSNAAPKDDEITTDEDILPEANPAPKDEPSLVKKKVTEEVSLEVTWASDKPLTTEKAGEFIYTAKLTDEGEGKFNLAEGVSLPTITVTVGAPLMTMAGTAARVTTLDLTGNVTYQKTDGNTATANASTTSITDTAEGWSWDLVSKILTLNDANIAGTNATNNAYGIVLPGDSTINLSGNNTVTAGTGTNSSFGISGKGNITINGTGNLDATSGKAGIDSYGILADAVDISGGTVNATGGEAEYYSSGIYAMGDVTISGAVTATGGTANNSFGISAEGAVDISGGTVTATGGKAIVSNGIYAKAVNISGGTVNATGGEAGVSYGISAEGAVDISGGTVTATGGKAEYSSGISAYAVDISGGIVNANGDKATTESHGISADAVTISGGTVNANGGKATTESHGIYAESAVTISGTSVVEATSGEAVDSYGIFAGGAVDISGTGTVTATGGEASNISYGIFAGGTVIISGASDVTANGGKADNNSCGIYVGGTLTISGTGTVTANGGKADNGNSYGIRADAVNINGGKNTANGGEAGSGSYGISSVRGTVTISDTSVVTATGGKAIASNGIYAKAVNISSGTVTATGGEAGNGSSGIFAMSAVTISGGTVTATGGEARNSYGIYAPDTVNFNGGKTTAKGGTFAVFCVSGITLGTAPIKMGITTPVGGKVAIVTDTEWGKVGYQIATGSGDTATEAVIEQVSTDGGNGGDSGSGDNGSSDDGSSSDSGNIAPPSGNMGSSTPPTQGSVTVSPTDNTNPPTQGSVTVLPTVSGDTATVTIPESTIKDVIAKAQAEAKKNDKTENGISVEIKADTGKATNLTANLPKATVDALVSAGVKETRITSGVATISLNLDTLKEIQKQAGSDVTVTATKVANSTLSAEAKALVGNRPVYDLSITGKNGTKVTNFGKGTVSVAIPYTLGANEKAGNVLAYYIDSTGKVQEMANSAYNSETKTLRFVTSHFSMYAVGYKTNAATFNDITNHWAKDSIEFVTARGLLSGTGNGTFAPDTAMTRGMFVTALGRLAGMDTKKYENTKFTDVKAGAYYDPYVAWANANGIVNGTTDTTFSPDTAITHEQMAVIMQNYAVAIGFALPKVHAENTFADNAKISSYAKDAVKIMQMAGVLAGKNGNQFDPQGTATRAEVSAVLQRFVELVIDRSTAEGWTTNDSGSSLYYQSGKAVTGTKTISNVAYTFNGYGETTRKTATAGATTNPALPADGRKYTTYTVQKGDSFWRIANKVGCTIAELEHLNGKSRNDIIYTGQVLKVPQK